MKNLDAKTHDISSEGIALKELVGNLVVPSRQEADWPK